MAQEAVIKYLVDTNRPYSCADVTVNLRGAYSKGIIQKTLDALSECGKIRCKLYGKQKVYAAIQTETTAGEDDVEDYETQLQTLTQTIEGNTAALKTAETSLKTLTSAPTTESAKAQIETMRSTIASLEDKLEALKNSVEVVSAAEKKKILDEHDKLYREYRNRKRTSNDMLDAVLEGYPKSKKALLEELCVETDEMVNFKVSAAN